MATMKDVKIINIGIGKDDYEIRITFKDGTHRNITVQDWKFDDDLYRLAMGIFDTIEAQEVDKDGK